jgi:hypothetical protein
VDLHDHGRKSEELLGNLQDMMQLLSEQHACIQKRIEESLGDSADKNAKWATYSQHAALQEEHASMQTRLESLEAESSCHRESLGDSADLWEAAHVQHNAFREEHASMQARIGYLEGLCGDSANKHTKFETAHDEAAEVHSHRRAALIDGVAFMGRASLEKRAEEGGVASDLATLFERVGKLDKTVCDSAAILERVIQLERAVGDLEDKHARWDAELAKHDDFMHQQFCRAEQQASMATRMAYIEKLLGDSADKHAQWEVEHARHREQRQEQDTLKAHHAAMMERLDYLEKQMGDSAAEHARWEAEHGNNHENRVLQEGFAEHHAAIATRLEYLDKQIGDSVECSATIEYAVTDLEYSAITEHAQWETEHVIHHEHRQRQDRDVEHNDSADNHAEWEAAHAKVEQRLDESLDKHVEWAERHDYRAALSEEAFSSECTFIPLPVVGCSVSDVRTVDPHHLDTQPDSSVHVRTFDQHHPDTLPESSVHVRTFDPHLPDSQPESSVQVAPILDQSSPRPLQALRQRAGALSTRLREREQQCLALKHALEDCGLALPAPCCDIAIAQSPTNPCDNDSRVKDNDCRRPLVACENLVQSSSQSKHLENPTCLISAQT